MSAVPKDSLAWVMKRRHALFDTHAAHCGECYLPLLVGADEDGTMALFCPACLKYIVLAEHLADMQAQLLAARQPRNGGVQ